MKRFAAVFAFGVVMVFGVAICKASPLTSPTTFTVTNLPPNINSMQMFIIEQQVAAQANGLFRRTWHTGQVQFAPTPGAVRIVFRAASATSSSCGEPAYGCHWDQPDGQLDIIVGYYNREIEESTLSHEVLETMVDPWWFANPTLINGHVAEVCDPVEAMDYKSDGVYLSHWVDPAYFQQP